MKGAATVVFLNLEPLSTTSPETVVLADTRLQA